MTPMTDMVGEQPSQVSPEDALRSRFYGLFADILSDAPEADLLAKCASLSGDDSQLGKAITTFAHVCARSNVAVVAREYHDLFIGVGRGELMPYGSYYLTGFLQEKPLARLRQDMERLGLERDPDVSDPEDHISALCEMMAGFIDGTYGEPLSLSEQKTFYDSHVGSWAGHFFDDLQTAKTSELYGALGAVGLAFLAIEEESLRMI